MNIQETAAVLAKIKLIDNRDVTELVIREWHDIIGHLEYGDAIEAVCEHRKGSTEYLLPGHVVRGARRAREARERHARIVSLRHEISANVITLDRERFEAETRKALDYYRAERANQTGTP